MNQVLVVDDEAGMRTALEGSFAGHGWQVESACGVRDALARFERKRHSLVVTDIRMADGDGFSVMRGVRSLSPGTAVVLLTAYGSVPDAVAAVKEGACDYLVKPVDFEQLEAAARRVLSQAWSQRQKSPAVSAPAFKKSSGAPAEIIGHSPQWLRALERARQAAASDADILIQAESGSGKELVARLVHESSARRGHPFVAVNCAAFPEQLLESELFGHAKGAFTGAHAARVGKFELAHGGTLLLDEAGELPLALQPKLLRALQEREFDRLGDTRPVHVDIRIIATTNRPLEAMVREGTFRADLYYRLNVIPLRLPPLRERREDIRELAEYFVRCYAGGAHVRLLPELIARLEQHRWPGNVRELANLMRRAVALSPGESGTETERQIGPEILDVEEGGGMAARSFTNGDFPLSTTDLSRNALPKSESFRPGISLNQAERELIEATLSATEGNRSRAAEMLGVSLRTVRNKIRAYGLPPRRSYRHE
ncbi:MAG TPA: sigma-54 dependent transcriptional regulator [Terriglobales bacterium]|jgi:DNA-binding NtrC family response regulator